MSKRSTYTLRDAYEMIVSLEPMPEDIWVSEDPRHPSSLAMKRFKVAEAFIKLALDIRRQELSPQHFVVQEE
tara:strand:+ start:2528 stop:2743 length:216 start_codon:yes stop_codon:yes gene_type:complete